MATTTVRRMSPPSAAAGTASTATSTTTSTARTQPLLGLASVIGTTADRPTLFRCNPATHTLAYAAGSVVVLHDLAHDKQLAFLHHDHHGSGGNAVSALAFSDDGAYLAVAESGLNPCVLVWDTLSCSLLAEIPGHRYGISCVAFSPRHRDVIVSVGVPHDGSLFVHNWRSAGGKKIASNKITSKVHAIAFLPGDGLTFVTAGHRHLKYWSLHGIEEPVRGRAAQQQLVEGRSAVLGEYRDATFVDLLADDSHPEDMRMFAFTSEGVLCSLGGSRTIERWVGLKAPTSYAMTIVGSYIVCGCNDGVVRLFNTADFKYVTTLPRAHSLPRADDGEDDSTASTNSANNNNKKVWPDCVALTSQGDHLITCLYSDRSIVQWNIAGMAEVAEPTPTLLSRKIEPQRCLRYPSSSVWAMQLVDSRLVTASTDGCLLLTDLLMSSLPSTRTASKFVPLQPNVAVMQRRHSGLVEAPANGANGTDGRGVRCVRVSKDHKIAVAGDKSGNLTVLETASWTRVASLAAHDSEVVAIDVVVVEQDARWLVASGSRDRLVHVFEAYYDAQGKLQFVPVQTFDDHTSAVTSICFGREGKLLISSSSDKSVIFRTSPKPGRQPYALQHQHTSRQTVLDMALYSDGSCVVLVGQDKRVTVLNVASGQIKQSFKPDTLDQSLVSIALDASNTVAFATAADKSIRVIDLVTEACIAGATGHGELVTTVQYVPQLQRIVSAAADGCVFHWKLAPQIVQLLAQRNGKTIASEPSEKENQEALKNAAFLPAWLRTKLDGAQQQQQQQQQQPMAQQGRWALPKEMQVHNEAKGSSIVVNLSKPLLADRRLTIEPDGTIVSYDTFSQADGHLFDIGDDELSLGGQSSSNGPLFVTASLSTAAPSAVEDNGTKADDAPKTLTSQILATMEQSTDMPEDESVLATRPSLSARFIIESRSAKAQRVAPSQFGTRPSPVASPVQQPQAAAAAAAPAPVQPVKKRDRTASMQEEMGMKAPPAASPVASVPSSKQPSASVEPTTLEEPLKIATPPKEQPQVQEHRQEQQAQQPSSLMSDLDTAKAQLADLFARLHNTLSADETRAADSFYDWIRGSLPQQQQQLSAQEQMLKAYSDRLVSLVEAKLQR